MVPAVPEIEKVEPTGVGDAFRAGFLAALEWDLSLERAAQLGCLLAVYVVEQVGTQEYTLHQQQFVDRFAGGLRRRGRRRDRRARQDPAPLTPSRVVTAAGAPRTAAPRRRRRPRRRTPDRASGTTPATSGRAAGSSATTASVPPTGTSAMLLASRMTGSGHASRGSPARCRRPRGHRRQPGGRSRRQDTGQRRQQPVDVGLGRVARQRHPDVAVGQRAHRGQHVRGLEAAGRARRARRDREPEPVELGHQGLAVDVEAGEGHQVRQPSHRVADDVDVRERSPAPARSRSTSAALPGADLVPLGDDRLQRGGRGERRPGRSRTRPPGRRCGRRSGTARASGRPCAPAARRRRRARPTCARRPPPPAQPPGRSTRPAAARGVREERVRRAGRPSPRPRRAAAACPPPGSPPGRRPPRSAQPPGPPPARRAARVPRGPRAPRPSYRRSGGTTTPRPPAPRSARPRCAPAGCWSVDGPAAARAPPGGPPACRRR